MAFTGVAHTDDCLSILPPRLPASSPVEPSIPGGVQPLGGHELTDSDPIWNSWNGTAN